jgi:hypothetical protein
MKTPSDADRYADVKLDLSCPKCGSGGLIPLKQLDRVLYCYGCRSRFGVERQGLVERPHDRVPVQVRTHSSDWQGHEAIIESRSTVFRNWLFDRGIDFLAHGWGRWALAAVVVLVIGGSVALGGRSTAKKPPLELPASLDGRAKMFTEALARRNMEVLIRLTDPAQHRALRIWLAHSSKVLQAVEDQEIDLNVKIVRTTLTSPAGDRADLSVQLSPSGGKQRALDEQWAQQGTVWYFQPVRLRSPPLVKGPVQPYSKAKKR